MSDQNKELKDQLLEAGRINPKLDIYDLLLGFIIVTPILKSAALATIGLYIVFFSNVSPERAGMGWSLVGYAIGTPTNNQKEYEELKSKKKKEIK